MPLLFASDASVVAGVWLWEFPASVVASFLLASPSARPLPLDGEAFFSSHMLAGSEGMSWPLMWRFVEV